jgi:hypothetical protein
VKIIVSNCRNIVFAAVCSSKVAIVETDTSANKAATSQLNLMFAKTSHVQESKKRGKQRKLCQQTN